MGICGPAATLCRQAADLAVLDITAIESACLALFLWGARGKGDELG